jgi:hypothetical protein
MARQQTANTEARLTTEPCGQLGIWIYVDGKLMDLIHYSDLLHACKPETRQAIKAIYADIQSEKLGEEE